MIKVGANTQFGKEHGFDKIKNLKDFQQQVSIRDYEELKPWIEKTKRGEKDVLWKGCPIYWAKTSGTTSGSKYIPVTKASINHHVDGAKNALVAYINDTQNADFVGGKMLYLSGNADLTDLNGILTGRLSGIVNHHIPTYLQRNQLPTMPVNLIADWETKLAAIVDESLKHDVRLVGGIPPWIQMYFRYLEERTGKKAKDVFPNLQIIVHGGANFEPYKASFVEAVGRPIDFIELYPSSEGYIAGQHWQEDRGLLLNTRAGLFFEFVPLDEINQSNPTRLGIGEVVIGKHYAIILSTNAGLWAYKLGDVVKFTSLKPYCIKMMGRTEQFLSAFGEHLIATEVEQCIAKVADDFNCTVREFTVAPLMKNTFGRPCHQWLIEFEKNPENLHAFSQKLDEQLQTKNPYYKDLRQGAILEPLQVKSLSPNTFDTYLTAIGKLGGQNKISHLSNDRKLAEGLLK